MVLYRQVKFTRLERRSNAKNNKQQSSLHNKTHHHYSSSSNNNNNNNNNNNSNDKNNNITLKSRIYRCITEPVHQLSRSEHAGKLIMPLVFIASIWSIFSSNPRNYTYLTSPSSTQYSSQSNSITKSSSSSNNDNQAVIINADKPVRNMIDHEPSHLRLCRSLLNRTSTMMRGEDISDYHPLVVEEKGGVCRDTEAPFVSLVQIFSSAVVGSIGKAMGLTYRHGCGVDSTTIQMGGGMGIGKRGDKKRKKDSEVEAIQQFLPAFLDLDGLELDDVVDVCRGCVNRIDYDEIMKLKGVDYHNLLSSMTLDCVLFPDFQANTKSPVEKSRAEQNPNPNFDENPNPNPNSNFNQNPNPNPNFNQNPNPNPNFNQNPHPHRRLQMMQSQSMMFNTILPSIKRHLQTASSKYTNNQKDPNSAVIYLSCTKERSNDNSCELMVMPLYLIAQDIPRSISSITIIVSSHCASYSLSCSMYAEAIQNFLTEVYPRSHISFSISDSSAATISKMISATYLFCTVGVSCLFAALGKSDYATMVESPSLYPWLTALRREVVGHGVRLLPEAVAASSSRQDLASVIRAMPTGRVCRDLRGRAGSWVQDFEYAREAQYSLPLLKYAGTADLRFQPTKDNLYRKPTTWKWVEGTFPSCKIELVDLDKLCHVFQQLGITRIFFLGDSLQFQMAQSLWKLIDSLDDFAEDKASAAKREVVCPKNSQFRFIFEFARNDRLLDVDRGPNHPKDKNCQYGYCWPWTRKYLDNPARTLVVANTGAHSHEHAIFNKDFDTFINLMDVLNRPNDLVYFRTSVPGHMNCDRFDMSPFKNYKDYEPTITEVYSWNKFIDYNDYATGLLDQRRRRQGEGEGQSTQVDLLDVYPMTVLRPDGHSGGADCIDCNNNDCLHYSLPGPVDWWNHLLYSDLLGRLRLQGKGRAAGKMR